MIKIKIRCRHIYICFIGICNANDEIRLSLLYIGCSNRIIPFKKKCRTKIITLGHTMREITSSLVDHPWCQMGRVDAIQYHKLSFFFSMDSRSHANHSISFCILLVLVNSMCAFNISFELSHLQRFFFLILHINCYCYVHWFEVHKTI